MEAALLISRAADDSEIALKEIACPDCESTARKLSKRGLINLWKNDGEGVKLSLSEDAEREVHRWLTTRG